ncbi:SDR family NAD(P)-dependent oxidoreductase [Sphingobium subterraneum]|uniref:3-oxoacyl-[acyl-carrier protein] reductase n=1 Tax=Sphingobium subterraneum TaxID=627688 RepID=A0A841IZB0_9SPHN|nr:SDR family NAD(P)-dependent oxidoreductase [Sphingobium subterraneum]MBB6123670.1 3-oxoacyl-[acyl-carrier protein] reductase [Sphingobium subterraneum]
MVVEGKVALVTGSSSGIGKSVALRLAKAGAKVAVVASSSVAKAQTVVDEIVAAGGTAAPFAVDLRNPDAVAGLVGDVEQQLGPVEILVTSAGIFLPTPIGDADLGTFNQMVDVNLKGTFYCVNAVVPGMKKLGGGKIVCLSSAADRLGIAAFATYCATKGGVTQMVKSLALELAPHNININAVCPGNTATPMNEAMRTDPSQRTLLDSLNAAVPSNNKFSSSDDVAELCYFLIASPGSNGMHGSSVLCDEGLSAGVSL